MATHRNDLRLIPFILRRERLRIVFWLFGLVFITLLVPVIFQSMYGAEADRIAMFPTLNNPAMIAMLGPVFAGESNFTLGAMIAGEMVLFTLLAVAIMNIFFVNRYTRRDEERGRNEVLRSLPIGRLSILSSTLIVAVIINLALALLTGFGLAALRVESLTFGGSLLYGAVLGMTGLFFAAVTALFSQLCASSRSVTGYSVAVMLILYLVRAVGDMNPSMVALSY
ncbi:MAG: ABC transporter permease, partial [Oscillospiraceae bacterium]|nr:ABC transporter permease [Oscillospiraceae bacterium]